MAVMSPPVLAVGSGELFDRWYQDNDVRARDALDSQRSLRTRNITSKPEIQDFGLLVLPIDETPCLTRQSNRSASLRSCSSRSGPRPGA